MNLSRPKEMGVLVKMHLNYQFVKPYMVMLRNGGTNVYQYERAMRENVLDVMNKLRKDGI